MPGEDRTIILYGRPGCAMTPPVRRVLDLAGVPYRVVNIHEDSAAAERVRAINGGSESVPTLVFPDGSTLTEPSTGALRRKLKAQGYPLPLRAALAAWVMDYAEVIVFVLAAVMATLAFLGYF
jgi:mycoredoxin